MRTFIILIAVLQVVYCDLAIFQGSLSPTGGIGMKERKYKLYYEIDILDDYPLESEFRPQLYLNYGGIYTNGDVTHDAKVIITKADGSTQDKGVGKIRGTDGGDVSYIQFLFKLGFEKGMKISVTINDFIFTGNGEEKDLVINAGFIKEANDKAYFIQYNRNKLPFHPYSFLASSKNKKNLTTRFTSSLGHHESAYILFKYPSCVTFNTQSVSASCNSITWLVFESGLEDSMVCSFNNNELQITNIGRSYPATKSQTIRFLIKLDTAHTCTGSEHTDVEIREKIGNRMLENAALFGFDERPICEENALKYETDNSGLVRDPVNDEDDEDDEEDEDDKDDDKDDDDNKDDNNDDEEEDDNIDETKNQSQSLKKSGANLGVSLSMISLLAIIIALIA